MPEPPNPAKSAPMGKNLRFCGLLPLPAGEQGVESRAGLERHAGGRGLCVKVGRRGYRARSLILAGAVLAGAASACHAQITTLDKGHSLLLTDGLQIWGLNTDSSSFHYSDLTGADLNAVMWSYGQANAGSLSTGQTWGKWADYTGSPSTALNSTENAHIADLVALQVGDEQQADIESPSSQTAAWFQAAHSGNYFANQLLYINSTYITSDAAYATFIANANPDAISFDAYPFGTTTLSPYNWLGKAQQFRRQALGSYIGADNNAPRPYGLYLQTYHSSSEGTRDPSDVEMRWQQFTAWTMGYTFADCFTFGSGSSSIDNGAAIQPAYNQFKETTRQSRNLGPALTRLISYANGNGGTSIVLGKDSSGNANLPPTSWKVWSPSDAPPGQQYMTLVSVHSLSSKNGSDPSNPGHGYAGDVYVGYFNPLLSSFGDPNGEAYFMVTNGLGGSLQDPTALVGDCKQQITMNFDFSASGITSLERLSRNTGQVEVINTSYSDGGNTIWSSLGGSLYRLQLTLDGGTGDLFKFNDGSPFVGVQSAPPPGAYYWDSDGSASGNSTSTGAGLGGSGNWDSSAKWYHNSAEASWTSGSDAIFWGTAGTVTLTAAQSANSLSFKTDGYTITGQTLTMSGSSISVDPDASATITSKLTGSAGLVKSGAGTLNLATANSYSGGTVINEGVLGIISNAVGVNPSSPEINITINNGATLRFNQNSLALTINRQFLLGSGGGVVETNYTNTILGAITGSSLTKTGTGTLILSNTDNSYSGGTFVNGGVLKMGGSSEQVLGAQPGSATDNIWLDGGTLQWGGNYDLNQHRTIVIGNSGGTLDTNGFQITGSTGNGNVTGPGTLTKTGAGTFLDGNIVSVPMIVISGPANSVYQIVNSSQLPQPASPVADALTLDGGTLRMFAVSWNSNANCGLTITSNGGYIDTNESGTGVAGHTSDLNLTWSGSINSAAGAMLTKQGGGLLVLNNSNPRSGSSKRLAWGSHGQQRDAAQWATTPTRRDSCRGMIRSTTRVCRRWCRR